MCIRDRSLSGCKDKETEIQDVPMMGSHILFGYDELTEHAKIIAKVKITDTLTCLLYTSRCV